MAKRKASERPEERPRVEVVEGEAGPQLVVDGLLRRHDTLPNGQLVLDDYAYDPADDLEELGRRFADHLDRAAAARAERGDA
ncbi:MAG TPA: hypothetical protein VNQ77_09305 [Frankiaceae bacterium]|nr:hypothetical protein [Frankiaceae bacterium]